MIQVYTKSILHKMVFFGVLRINLNLLLSVVCSSGGSSIADQKTRERRDVQMIKCWLRNCVAFRAIFHRLFFRVVDGMFFDGPRTVTHLVTQKTWNIHDAGFLVIEQPEKILKYNQCLSARFPTHFVQFICT